MGTFSLSPVKQLIDQPPRMKPAQRPFLRHAFEAGLDESSEGGVVPTQHDRVWLVGQVVTDDA